MYSNSSEDLHTLNNQVMSTISLLCMRQEKGQSMQSLQDQFTAIRQVWEQLGLTIRQLEQGAKAVLRSEGVTDPTTKQLEKARKKAVEEFFAILFLYLADRQKYGTSSKTWKMHFCRKGPFSKKCESCV